MKFCVFLCLCVVLFCSVKQSEGLKILKKLKELLHPTTTTTTAPPEVTVVDHCPPEEPQEWTSTTVAWKEDDNRDPATVDKGTQYSYSDTVEPEENNPLPTIPSSAVEEKDEQKFQVPSSTGFISGNGTPKYPGMPETFPTSTDYNYSQFEPSQKPSEAANSVENQVSATQDSDSHFQLPTSPDTNRNLTTNSDDFNNNPNQETKPTIPTNTDNHYNQIQPEPQPSLPEVGGQSGIPTQSAAEEFKFDQQHPFTVPDEKQTTQPTPNDDTPQHSENHSDDDVLIFPDHPHLNEIPESSSGKSTERTAKAPILEVDGRNIAKAPTKDCGAGKRADDSGNCRKIARK